MLNYLTISVIGAVLITEVLVVPAILSTWIPVVIKGILVDNDFHGGVADRTTEVVISLNTHFHFFSEAECFLLAILFWSFYFNFELGKFVFFKSKQFCGSDGVMASGIPKVNRVLTQWELFAELERAPRTAKGVQ